AEAAQAPPGSEGLIFLPYLTGERTPHADPHARGAWIGLSLRHGRAHLARSVIEGATYAMRDSLEIIRELRIPAKEVRLSGGGARSGFWRQLQADVYGMKVVTTNSHEGPAYGVALLAAVGTGAYKSIVEACQATIKVVDGAAPQAKARKVYDAEYPLYQRMYRSLKEDFRILADVVAATS
ncbi:MAG: xylulokinase, partial [Planctomycetaceae bacterium]